jgi:hypothetical protein
MPASSKDNDLERGNPQWLWKTQYEAPYPRDGRLGKAQNCRSLEESAHRSAWAERCRMAESVAATLLR